MFPLEITKNKAHKANVASLCLVERLRFLKNAFMITYLRKSPCGPAGPSLVPLSDSQPSVHSPICLPSVRPSARASVYRHSTLRPSLHSPVPASPFATSYDARDLRLWVNPFISWCLYSRQPSLPVPIQNEIL